MELEPPGRSRILELDLSRPVEPLEGHVGYDVAWVLVRLQGAPAGFVEIPLTDGAASAEAVATAIAEQLPDVDSRIDAPPPRPPSWPSLTVAVCTRGRPDDLEDCLHALRGLDYEDLEILVVDNAPTDDATARVCARHPQVKYVVEPRPGLDWARNRAVLRASGDVIAFTDDDARVDPGWARALVAALLACDTTMAAAGLVIPLELETSAQVAFEQYGGLSGGLDVVELKGQLDWGVRGFWHYLLVAQQGSGANMAFRRAAFERVGLFDPALDVGTPSNGGGDTEMFFRIMAEGWGFRYEPRAVVRHRHRRSEDALKRQVQGWGSGIFALLTRSTLAYPRAGWVFLVFALRSLGLLLIQLPPGRHFRLALYQLSGALLGPARYLSGRRRAAAIERRFGPQRDLEG